MLDLTLINGVWWTQVLLESPKLIGSELQEMTQCKQPWPPSHGTVEREY